MKINSRSFGLAIAVIAAFFWSIYSLGNLVTDILIIALIDGANYSIFSNFNWSSYINRFLAEIGFITLGTAGFGWLTAEIYNDFNDVFKLKLK